MTRGRWSRRSLACLSSAAVSLVFFSESGCRGSAPSAPAQAGAAAAAAAPVAPARVAAARAAYEAARLKAWETRRFKALFAAEVSPRVGAVTRGWLSAFWDGETLEWKASAPLAGKGKSGSIRRGESGGASGEALPGHLPPADLLAAFLGAPDTPLPEDGGSEEKRGRVRLLLDGKGRSAVVDESGSIIELDFPGKVRVLYQPGEGLPRRIEALSPDGDAVLVLKSYGPWP